ncbi:MAG: RluA family pseudouridine synthase [Planctomycetota bacterium]
MPPAFRILHVSSEQSGLALAPVLRQWTGGTPWSTVHRWIENRHVQVNGNLCTDRGRKLREGDVVKLWKEPRPAPPKEGDLRVRYVDRDLVVVEKPAGVTTLRHSEEQDWSPRRRQVQPTLDEMLLVILVRRSKSSRERSRGAQRRATPDRPRLRAVHRLDRDTSGLMLFALSAAAERRLVQMFRKHEVERTYLALAHGQIEEQTFDTRFVRDRGDGRRGSTGHPTEGKRAVTHVRPIERLGDYTLIECRLETGRTHQIRIHLAEAGHMLCGERVYNKPLFGPTIDDRSGATRQALHAARLELKHPITGARLQFEMPLPADMQRLLDKLRKSQ